MKNIFAALSNSYPQAEEIDWQAVYAHSLPRVYHFFCYKVGDACLAEDLTAATFEKAWRSRANFRAESGQAHAWLMGIARNVACDHFRRKLRETPLEEESAPALTASYEEQFQRQAEFQAIAAILARYPEREQELVALKYGAELSNREIARLTGLSESNVGTILHRVIARLRCEWESQNER